MAWETPKKDWDTEDRFNAADFNRIKNNLDYLRELAITMYEEFTIASLGTDRTAKDYFYADEINQLEKNLETVNNSTIQRTYGTPPIYSDNGNTMDYVELNRLESAILDLYDRMSNESSGRRMFTWNFGFKGGEL